MAYTTFYGAVSSALEALFQGDAVGTHAICDWLAEQRPDTVEALEKDGYSAESSGWTWPVYVANVLSRMARDGRVERVGKTIEIPDGYTQPVSTWAPGSKREAEVTEEPFEHDQIMAKLTGARASELRRVASANGTTLKAIVEQAVDTFLDSKGVEAPAVAEQIELLPAEKKAKSAFDPSTLEDSRPPLRVAGLFAGIGGVETGLSRSGHTTELLCEIDAGARQVLSTHFPEVRLHDDICTLKKLPDGTEMLTAGFPCTDLSQAGKTAGIQGAKSGLIGEVYRLLEQQRVPWVLLENVPFMLQLARGEAMEVIVQMMEDLGYRWAYRVLDSRAFGVPQRRKRVILLGALEHDPRDVLLCDDAGELAEPTKEGWQGTACGFYWTEGKRGLGWAHDAVPTLKPGSTVGIPSPPAIVLPNGRVIQPDIRDAERMQGFDVDWTACTVEAGVRASHRWRLVGNAVTVQLAEWLGKRLRAPGEYDRTGDSILERPGRWPNACWGENGKRWIADVSNWPVHTERPSLVKFLEFDGRPLSERASRGFLSRAETASLRFPDGFLDILRSHADHVASIPARS